MICGTRRISIENNIHPGLDVSQRVDPIHKPNVTTSISANAEENRPTSGIMCNVLPFIRGNKLPLGAQTRNPSIPFSSSFEFLIYSISVLCEIPLFSGLAKIPLLYLLATIVAKMGRGLLITSCCLLIDTTEKAR